MALYDVQYIKHNVNGLPEDDVVMTLHFEDNDSGTDSITASTIAGYVAASHFDAADGTDDLEGYISPVISRVFLPTIKVYDGESPGSPLAVETQAGMHAAINAVGLPNEVACCLSFRGDYGLALEDAPDDSDADSAPERPRSRRRGRVFEGPFNVAAINGAAPHPPITALRLALLNFGERLGAIGDVPALAGLDMTWVVKSLATGAPTTSEITEAYVDNAWDTQRRRGLAPTGRSTVAITQ